MQQMIQRPPAKFGLLGFVLGVVSLLVVFIQLSALFEPQEKTTGTMIGEVAAEIKQSAVRALAGKPAPEPEPVPQDYSRLITIASLGAAGLAVILGGVGLYRSEPHRLSYLAIGTGVSAFVMLYAFWLAMLICGVVVLLSVLENLDSIFD